MLGLKKPNFRTEIIHFEISLNAENCNKHSVAKFQKKLKGNPLESLKNFRKKNKKMRIFNSLIVPKNLKEGTLWDSLTVVLLQNIKTN